MTFVRTPGDGRWIDVELFAVPVRVLRAFLAPFLGPFPRVRLPAREGPKARAPGGQAFAAGVAPAVELVATMLRVRARATGERGRDARRRLEVLLAAHRDAGAGPGGPEGRYSPRGRLLECLADEFLYALDAPPCHRIETAGTYEQMLDVALRFRLGGRSLYPSPFGGAYRDLTRKRFFWFTASLSEDPNPFQRRWAVTWPDDLPRYLRALRRPRAPLSASRIYQSVRRGGSWVGHGVGPREYVAGHRAHLEHAEACIDALLPELESAQATDSALLGRALDASGDD
ncbi:MAG TPA: hypothetical protein VFS43_24850 [Polyangiaceae bacterium]|nr:hypothetical protein [Polyangiaceae bacterium]